MAEAQASASRCCHGPFPVVLGEEVLSNRSGLVLLPRSEDYELPAVFESEEGKTCHFRLWLAFPLGGEEVCANRFGYGFAAAAEEK